MKAIASVRELRDGTVKTFSFRRDGIRIDAFVYFRDGDIHAFENRCRHLPLSLDYGDGRFFAPDSGAIICHTHGAVYDPQSGNCIEGPCRGLALFRVPIEEHDGMIWVQDELE